MKTGDLRLWLVLALCTSACSTINETLYPPGIKLDWDSVSLYIDPAANRNFPVAVDVVVVLDETLANKIASMKSIEWFAARDTLRKTHPGQIEMESVELAPSETLTLATKRLTRQRVYVAMAFADYFASGDHKLRLDTLKGRLSLEFGATDFSAFASRK